MKKLLCKKDATNYEGVLWVYKDKYYRYYVENDFYYVICDKLNNYTLKHEYAELSFYKYTSPTTVIGYIWDHFYTEKEIRKLKLERLK